MPGSPWSKPGHSSWQILVHSRLEQQRECFPKEMKLQWIIMMNSLGQQLILWRTVLKMFFFSVNEMLSHQKALTNGLPGMWPISTARWTCLFPGNTTWGLASQSVSQGTSDALWSRQACRAASGWHGFRRAEPPAPCALCRKTHQNHQPQWKFAHIRKKHQELGAIKKSKGLNNEAKGCKPVSKWANQGSGSCFPRAWRGFITEIRSDPRSSSLAELISGY